MKRRQDFERRLSERLERRAASGSLRRLSTPDGSLTDFCSNDYLGLARSEELKSRIAQAHEALPTSNGATGSRLLSGNALYMEETEAFLAEFFQAEAALVFNSGYAANQAVVSALPQRGDLIVYDEQAHACMKDGARLSLAKRLSFRHNDVDDLEKKLKKHAPAHKGGAYVVVESVYSMDGDLAPLHELFAVCERQDAALMVDEAHGTGVFGPKGEGLAVAEGLHDRALARIYTFGKAAGVHGAVVCGSRALIDYLVNFARPFIYTTALSAHSWAAIGEAVAFMGEAHEERQELHALIKHWNDSPAPSASRNPSAIQYLETPGVKACRAAAQALQTAGFDVRPILAPTVQEGRERLRVCLHAFNTGDEIDGLLVAYRTFVVQA